jgi:hypothetical protein
VPQQQLLLGTVTTGMMGGGCFVLSPLPLASLAWVGVMGLGALLTLARLGQPELMPLMLVLVCYGTLVALGALGWWRTSLALLRSQAEAVRQERMLAVLLQDFEQNAGDALWETGPDGVHPPVSPRLAEPAGRAGTSSCAPAAADPAGRSAGSAGAAPSARGAGRRAAVPRPGPGAWAAAPTQRHLLINGKRCSTTQGRTRGLARCAGRRHRQGASNSAARAGAHRFADRAGQPPHAARTPGRTRWRGPQAGRC